MTAAARWHFDRFGVWPNYETWRNADIHHPSAGYVRAMFGNWATFIRAAGGEAGKTRTLFWTTERIIVAMQAWASTHDGNPPTSREWVHASVDHPTNKTVQERFGSWNNGLEAAGFWRRGQYGTVLVGREWQGPRGERSHKRRGLARRKKVAA